MLTNHLLTTKKEFRNLKKQDIPDIFIKKKLKKACFHHDMAYEDFKDILRRRATDKIL